ncbi:MAG: hypothetical protein QF464_21400, partial [Myxococcota bacterium]|nr:hypothetical protein [Myxococcota bacterium]
WLGPTNFNAKNARRLGPTLNKMVREAIEEFDGPAVFVNARKATSTSEGEAASTYRHPTKGTRPLRTKDGIHLTTEAVRWLLAEPVYQAFGDCWDADTAARDAIRAQRMAERVAKRKAKREAKELAAEARKQARDEAREGAREDAQERAKARALKAAKKREERAKRKRRASSSSQGTDSQDCPAEDKDASKAKGGDTAGETEDGERRRTD